jgi:hypothetical protein
MATTFMQCGLQGSDRYDRTQPGHQGVGHTIESGFRYARQRRRSPSRDPRQSPVQRTRVRAAVEQRGQSVVEFALIVPLLLFLVVAIADLGRLYVSAVAVEAAAREAADYGAFKAEYWMPVNMATTRAEMERRACTAAAGSHLEGYTEPPGTVDHSTCSNPTFSCTLEKSGSSIDCLDPTLDCSDPTAEPPCIVHARMEYDFTMIGAFPPLPQTLHFGRDSRFAVSDLVVPSPSP